MKLPNAELAVVDIAKLRDYCLNPQHPRGKHKARVFSAVLGFTIVDAGKLREIFSLPSKHAPHLPEPGTNMETAIR